MSVAIVTDGAAALPAELVAHWGITVVPMWITIGGQPELEGTRSLDELLQAGDVLTSAPTPGEFEAATKECLQTADSALVLTIADSMSATNEAARVGTAALDGSVVVFDTGSAAGGQALVVLAAAAAAARPDATLEHVLHRARTVADRVRLVATLPSLDHLVRGGRVPGIAGWAGKRLGINPLFEFRAGAVRRLRPALSRDAAVERILGHLRRTAIPEGRLHVVALHALAEPVANELLDHVRSEFAPVESFLGEFGPVMVVHTGPGLSGLAWWWDEPASAVSG
jgi:DegV family protein with EDD domain